MKYVDGIGVLIPQWNYFFFYYFIFHIFFTEKKNQFAWPNDQA